MKQAQSKGMRLSVRLLSMLCACLILVGGTVIGASAAEANRPAGSVPTQVYLEGVPILDGECFIYDSITYVPLRSFSNVFADCEIEWNAKTSTATVSTPELFLTVQSGAVYITANGRSFYTVGRVLNVGGRLYVPIRPLAKAFAEEVTWNAEARSVELRHIGTVRAAAPASYDSGELYWLSRIISAEAKGEPLEGQIAVGNVVLNRVRSSQYPNTIYGVIFDRKHGTQFSPVSFGTIYQAPTASAIVAAKICLEGDSISNRALFFVNPRLATNNWIQRNRPYAFTIGNHDFYN